MNTTNSATVRLARLAPLMQAAPVEIWSQLVAAAVLGSALEPTVEFFDEPTVVTEVVTVVERRVRS